LKQKVWTSPYKLFSHFLKNVCNSNPLLLFAEFFFGQHFIKNLVKPERNAAVHSFAIFLRE